MGKVLELLKLFKSFIDPIEEEKGFDELAVAAGISAEDRAILKKSMGGVSWKFDEGNEESKKTRKDKISPSQVAIETEQKRVATERNKGFDRED